MHDERFMRRAITIAHRGAGHVAPNPLVGAMLIHEGRILAEGLHAKYGDVHAEVACLNAVSVADRALIPRSTMYVTLEPCAHQGKQPPCAQRLVAEGIRHIVIATEDPFAQVSGKGIEILKNAGVRVEVGLCKNEARWLCRRFLSIQEKGRPYIILKWAQSADGFFAPANGSRHQLSNGFSQTLVHKWRTEESAIMVGYNTALADNPRLTARDWAGPQPLRVALDRALKLPQSQHLLDNSTPTWIVNEHEERAGVTSLMRMSFGEFLLPSLLSRLASAGKTSLFVEGGAKLLNSFIAAGLWDEARVFATPQMLRNGIAAPQLRNGQLALGTSAGCDTLSLYQQSDSAYPYPAGAIF